MVIQQSERAGLELRDYLRILRRRRGLVVFVTLVVLGTALAISLLQTPIYEASSEVLLQERSTESLFDPNTGQPTHPERAVETQIRVLKSKPLQAVVRDKLGSAPKISASAVGQTDVIQIRARSADPRRAAAVADAYATAYIEFRRKQAVDDVLAAGQEVQVKVLDLQKQIDDLNRQVSNAPSAQRQQAEDSIASQRQALVAQQALFKQRLDQLQVDAALKTGGARLVTPASVPESPVKPQPVRSAVVALVLGSGLGIALALLFEHLDDSIKGKEDVEHVTGGLPTLGLIPMVPSWKDRTRPLVVSLADPKSPPAEAYRTLRTSIEFIGLERPMRTLQVTSPAATEGKSTTIANLAVTLAQAGKRVVILCCDMRRPRIHEFFGLSNEIGFTSVLLGKVPLESALQSVEGVDGLQLLASGPLAPNPSELLSGRRTVELFTSLQASVDIVLIDSPPVLPVTDAAVLSGRLDATLLVATAGVTTRKELGRAYEVLAQVEAPVIGTVLNGVSAEGAYGYSSRYYSRYTSEESDGRKGRRREPAARP